MSPRFTTPEEGSTDKSGGGKEGVEGEGAASGRIQIRREEENDYPQFYR